MDWIDAVRLQPRLDSFAAVGSVRTAVIDGPCRTLPTTKVRYVIPILAMATTSNDLTTADNKCALARASQCTERLLTVSAQPCGISRPTTTLRRHRSTSPPLQHNCAQARACARKGPRQRTLPRRSVLGIRTSADGGALLDCKPVCAVHPVQIGSC
jgi:hypothetical protein